MSWFYYVGRFLVRVLLLFTKYELKGKENIPKEGPLIVVANHLSLADPPILGTVINRKMFFMAKEELFRSKLSGYFVRSYGAFPVHRGKPEVRAIREAERMLKSGSALAIFPEGRRNLNGELGDTSPGVALLAHLSGASILPVGISGTERVKGLGWLFHRPRITVRIGSAFIPVLPDKKMTRKALQEVTDDIMRHVAELLTAEYGGTYKG